MVTIGFSGIFAGLFYFIFTSIKTLRRHQERMNQLGNQHVENMKQLETQHTENMEKLKVQIKELDLQHKDNVTLFGHNCDCGHCLNGIKTKVTSRSDNTFETNPRWGNRGFSDA